MKKRFLFIFCLFLSVSVFGENILSLMGFPLGCNKRVVIKTMDNFGYKVSNITDSVSDHEDLWFEPIDKSKLTEVFNISANSFIFQFDKNTDSLKSIFLFGDSKSVSSLIKELKALYSDASGNIRNEEKVGRSEFILQDYYSSNEISITFATDLIDYDESPVPISLLFQKSL